MKLVTFLAGKEYKTGILKEDKIIEIKKEAGSQLQMLDLIDLASPAGQKPDFSLLEELGQGQEFTLDQVKIMAPIRYPRRNLFCLGLNYIDHAKEVSFKDGQEPELPKFPVYFSKIAWPALEEAGTIDYDESITKMLDYEVELAVIIGREGKNISQEDAISYVFGYTIANDISARNVQRKHGQWFKGKSIDGYAPMGPYILTADQVKNPDNLDLKTYVNDELRQDSNTKQMIFSLSEVISDLSKGLTLQKGDIILTGTPAGVGLGFKPYKFLNPGDIVRCEIEELGSLTTYIR